MSNLYKELAGVYEAMYYSFIDYEQEYEFYSGILRQYQKKGVLEIGSGTGNLARIFIENGFEYLGLDISEEMIAIAKSKLKNAVFLLGDMRGFELEQPSPSALITGRSVSYLLKNDDVLNAFTSIHRNLEPNGIFCFDFIDANVFIPSILKEGHVVHEASFKGKHYVRKSQWSVCLQDGMGFKWDATYFVKSKEGLVELGQDESIVRTFTVNEIEIYLKVCGFRVLELIERASYAFPTYVVVAERVALSKESI